MRPLHSLLLLALLAVLGLGAWFLTGRGTARSGVAESIDLARVERDEEPRTPAELALPDAAIERREATVTTADDPPAAAASSAERTTAAQRTVSGRIVDQSGRAVVGAMVRAHASGVDFATIDLAGLGLDEDTPGLRERGAVSDADGAFRVPAPAGNVARISVRAGGFAPLDAERVLAATGPTELGDIPLQAGIVLEGVVVDETGNPIAGAELRALALDDGAPFFFLGGERGRLLTKSDERGAFVADQLPAGPYKIAVTSPEHVGGLLEGALTSGGQRRGGLRVELARGLAVEGRVRGLPDELPAKLTVSAAPSADGSSAALRGPTRSAPLAADGTFRIVGLAPGARVRVSLREGDGWNAATRSAAAVVEAGARDVVLDWRRDTAIVFQVVDGASGAPLEEFGVEAGIDWPRPLLDDAGRAVERHPEGRVRFGGLYPRGDASTARLTIEAKGYESLRREGIDLSGSGDVDLGVLRLVPRPLVRVHVVDAATGQPLRRVRVTMQPAPDAPPPGPDGNRSITMTRTIGGDAGGEDLAPSMLVADGESGTTDEAGLVELTSAPGKRVQLRARKNGYAELVGDPVVLPTDADFEWRAELTRGGTVLVRAIDAEGAPLAGTRIEHLAPGAERAPLFGRGANERTDQDGRVRFEHLAAGTHRFRFAARGETPAIMIDEGSGAAVSFSGLAGGGERDEAPWSEVTVVEGGEHELALLGTPPAVVSGRITEEGLALPGATVRLKAVREDGAADLPPLPFGERGPEARTDAAGRFRLSDVDPGRYVLEIAHASRVLPATREVELAVGENDLGTLDLLVSVIEGRVLDAEGDPVSGARVTARLVDPEGRQVVRMASAIMVGPGGESDTQIEVGGAAGGAVLSDEDGRYRLRGVVPGRDLAVHASAKGFSADRSATLTIDDGETRSKIDVVLRAGGTIRVQVTNADGSAASHVIVTAMYTDRAAGLEPQTRFLQDGGEIRFDDLAPGSWRVVATPIRMMGGEGPISEREDPERTVEVRAGEEVEAPITLP